MIKRLTYFISLLLLPSITLAQHSLSFDGVDDKVSAQSIIFQNDDSLTISMWLKPESFSSTSTNTFLRQDNSSGGGDA